MPQLKCDSCTDYQGEMGFFIRIKTGKSYFDYGPVSRQSHHKLHAVRVMEWMGGVPIMNATGNLRQS